MHTQREFAKYIVSEGGHVHFSVKGNQNNLLKCSKLTGNTRPRSEAPGWNVRQKGGLNGSILETSWYKLEWMFAYQTSIHKVAPKYTSLRCNRCGATDQKNRTIQSEFGCVGCGHSDHADIYAAKNLLALGIGESLNGRGEG